VRENQVIGIKKLCNIKLADFDCSMEMIDLGGFAT